MSQKKSIPLAAARGHKLTVMDKDQQSLDVQLLSRAGRPLSKVMVPIDGVQALEPKQVQSGAASGQGGPADERASDGFGQTEHRSDMFILADASRSMDAATQDPSGLSVTDAPSVSWTLAQAGSNTSGATLMATVGAEPAAQDRSPGEDDDREGLLWWLTGTSSVLTLGLGAGLVGLGVQAASHAKDPAAALDVSLGAGPFKTGVFVIQIFGRDGLMLTLSWDDAGQLHTQSNSPLAADVRVQTSTTVDGHKVVTGLSMSFSTYTGPVLAVLFDPDTTDGKPIEYFDEVAGVIALDSALRAMTTIHAGQNYLAITPFTELATRLALGQTYSAAADYARVLNTSPEVSKLQEANQTVSKWLGVDIVGVLPTAVNDVAYLSQTSTTAKAYGDALAALSRLVPGTLMGGVEKLLTVSTHAAGTTGGADTAVTALLSQALVDYRNEMTGVTLTTVLFDAVVSAKSQLNATDVSQLHISGTSLNAPEGSLVQVVLTDGSGQIHALQAQVNADGHWSVALPGGLPEGALQLKAYVNVNHAAELSLSYDSTAPAAPASVPAMLASSDTGVSTSDGITSDTRPVFDVSALPAGASAVQLLVDGVVVPAVYDSQTHTLRPAQALEQGAHNIQYRYVDAAGNAGDVSSSQSIHIDTIAPTTTVSGLQLSHDTGDSSTDWLTSEVSQTISGTLSAALGSDEKLYGSLDGGLTWVDISAGVNGTQLSWEGATLPSGQGTVVLKVVDAAGNEVLSPSQSYTLDTTAPAAPTSVPAMLVSSDTGGNPSDGVTSDARPVFDVSALPAGASAVQLLVDGVVVPAVYDSQTHTLRPAQALEQGAHNIQYRYVDAAGNAGDVSSSQSIHIDTIAPTTTVSGLQLSHDTGDSSTDWLTSEVSQTISGTLSAALGSDEKLYGSLDGGLTWVDISAGVNGTQLSWEGATLPSGQGTVVLKVVDAAGNEVLSPSQSYTLDTTAPAAPGSIPAMLASSDTGGSTSDGITSDTRPVFDVSALPAGASAVQLLVDGVVVPAVYDSQTHTLRPAQALEQGAHNIQYRYADAAGNAGDVSDALVVLIDELAPQPLLLGVDISVDSGVSDSDFLTHVSGQTVTGQLDSTMASGDRLLGSLDGGVTWSDISSMVDAYGHLSWTGVSLSGTTGSLQFKLVDAAGNTGLVSRQTYTLDTTAPTTTVSGLQLSHDTGDSSTDWLTSEVSQTISGTLSAALGSDEKLYGSLDGGLTWVDISAGVNGTQLSWEGATLPSGQGTVVLKVVDAAGNEVLSPSQSYTLDTTAPAAPTIVPAMLASSDTGGNPSDGVTSDARPVFMVGQLPAGATGLALWVNGVLEPATYDSQTHTLRPNAALTDGQYQISYSYVDAAGNASTVSPSLNMVLDSAAPHSSAITGVSTSTLSGTFEPGCTLTLTIEGTPVTGTITRNGGTWSYMPSPAELNYMSTHHASEIKLVVTDLAGNVAQVEHTVTSNDFDAPHIREFLPADSGVLANDVSGHATLNVVFSKAVRAGTGSIRVYDLNNTLVATVPVNSEDVRIDGDAQNDVYVTLPGLAVGTQYYVTFDARTFVDVNNQAFAGQLLTGTGGWDFTAVAASIAPDFVAADDTINAAERSAPVEIRGRVVGSGAVLGAILASDLSIDVRDANNQPVVVVVTGYDPGTGTFTFEVASNAWTEGTYRYTVSLSGSSGAATGVTASYHFNNLVVDLTGPTMTSSLESGQDDEGSKTGELWPGTTVLASSDDTSPYLSGTLSAALTGDARVVVYRQDVSDPNHPGALQNITGSEGLQPTGTGWSVSDSGLQDGHVYRYTAYVEDAAGNRSGASVSKSIAIDATPPATRISDLQLLPDTGASSTDWVSNAPGQFISGVLSSPLATGEKLYGSLDGGLTWADISGSVSTNAMSSGSSVITTTVLLWRSMTLEPGHSAVQFKVVDEAGNAGPVTSQPYTLDTTSPVVPTVNPLVVDAAAAKVLTGTANLGVDEQLTVTVHGASYAVTPVNGIWSLNLGTATRTSGTLGQFVAGQSYEVVATVKDLAGNTSTDGTHTELTINAPVFSGISLSAMAAGSGGFVINGQGVGDVSGMSVSGAGDVNGDGLEDLIVGAPGSDPSGVYNAGRSYVVFGQTTNAAIDLSAVAAGVGGFVINGQCQMDRIGGAVSGAGDVNGDGLADLIVGGDAASVLEGRSYVVFGKSTGTAINLSAVAGGTGGFMLAARGALMDHVGISVSGAGDVNGDGLADLLVGASTTTIAGRNSVGRSYVVFGKSTGTTINLLSLVLGSSSEGFVINGQQDTERSGESVSAVGDVNGDGLADLIVGSFQASTSTKGTAGRSYVVFGKTNTFPVDVAGVVEEQGGFVINGASGYDLSGISVAGAGDVNGDGLADLIVGAIGADTAAGADAGRSYVVFGKSNDATAIDLSAVAAGTGGFVINGQCAGDFSGDRVSSAGDINGDGLADLIVGVRSSSLAPGAYAGRSYVVFGKSTGAAIDLSAVDAGSGGFVISGQCAGDSSGSGVSAAGDVNGDGLADLIVGAPFSVPAAGMQAGRSYVIFGSTSGAFNQTAVDWLGTSGDDSYAASAVGQTLVAGAGNDTLTSYGATVLQGGVGNDTFVLDSAMLTALTTHGLSSDVLARVDGGSGTDTISLGGGSGLVLNLTQIANQAAGATEVGSRISSVERIDLTGAGHNTLTLAPADILDMAGLNLFNNGNGWTGLGDSVARHQLVVDGNVGDVLNASGEWRLGAIVTVGGQTYQAYDSASTAAQLLVDVDISCNILVRMPYAPIALSAIAAGVGGFAISGQGTYSSLGYSVSGAGDFNGDGLADLILGGFAAGTPGKSFVLFGKTSGLSIEMSDLAAGSGGLVINGQGFGDIAGTSVSAAGDVNGDGLADLVVGSMYAGANAGRSYVVFGHSAGTAINLSAVAAGTGGFAINGQAANDQSGYSVSGAGDVNGDGLSDLIVGAPFSANAGRSYVVFGKSSGSGIDLSAVASGNGGFVVNGQGVGDQSGYSVSGAGDVNGDGLADLIVGALQSDPVTGTDAGRSYVVFGKSSGTAINLSAVAAGAGGGFVIYGQSAGDLSGASVSGAGDVNGDGLADLLVGAGAADPAGGANAGRSYVVFGKTSGTAISLSAVAAGTGGFVINGQCAGDVSGMGLSNAGDVNGDGLADVLIGASGTDRGVSLNVGSGYVVYGKTSTAAIDLSAVVAGTGGFVINGANNSDQSSYSVAGAGDVNGDGLADLVVGAPGVYSGANPNVGRSYVIFGGTTGTFFQSAVDWLGTSGDDSRAATAAGQTLVGAAGNDTLTANGATVLQGGAGNDTFVLDSGTLTALKTNALSSGVLAHVDGGSGIDTIKLSGTGLTLDLTLIANQAAGDLEGLSRINSVERIDLTGAGNSTLKLMARDVMDMSGFDLFATTGRHQLLVKADTGDVIDLADATGTTGWTHAADTVISGVAYQTWNHNTQLATLYVDPICQVI